jgi:hypothetical protein
VWNGGPAPDDRGHRCDSRPHDPAAAGYQLAKRITGLPDGLVALIGGDQITDSAILGCPVPEPVRPILSVVDDRSEPVLQVPDMAAPEPIIDTTPPKEEFAEALGRLLQGRNARIRPRKLPPQLRSRFQVLRADGILDGATARFCEPVYISPIIEHCQSESGMASTACGLLPNACSRFVRFPSRRR